MANNEPFSFEISLSVLDHLGRNLYRSFATVLGEAISNSWDANAHNVWIYLDRDKNSFLIKDDGDGMNSDDFQHKFLKIGYSKRKKGNDTSSEGRPYIGRKGIGKLALLSCAEKITVISKVKNGEYVGGLIDNSGLDRAIKDDLIPSKYPLEKPNFKTLSKYTEDHKKGTIIYFENIKEGIRNKPEYLRKIVALYFRFCLLDDSFNIFLDDNEITLDDLSDLAQKTQFLWNINNLDDPFLKEKLKYLRQPEKAITMAGNVKGFIASVEKPKDLKIYGTDEKVTIDLFVNGRLREKDILKRIPTERLVESYLYGQIHFNDLDDEKDRFTSSREGIVADDPKYEGFLENLKKIFSEIFNDWDKWRLENRNEGDSENTRMSRKDRSSISLYNAVSEEYSVAKSPEKKEKLDEWVDNLAEDARFNFTSYAECFISENLIRKYIQDNKIPLSSEAQTAIDEWKRIEGLHKTSGNISIEIRRKIDDVSYLDMDGLANLIDKTRTTKDLTNDAKQYRPIRNAVMHTALLTDEAKRKLTTVYENIKGRINTLLSDK